MLIQTADSKAQQATKPPAEPPLFGIAGKPPRLVRKADTHNVIFYNGWYYGVPHALADVDLTDPETASRSGIIRFTTEEEVITSVEESAQWANSRGQYNDQKKQRTAGSYLRVDSASEVSGMGELPAKPRILQYGKSYFAVDKQTLANAFTVRWFSRAIKSNRNVTTSVSARTISGATFVRRMVTRLPPSLVDKMERLIRQQFYSNGKATAPLVTKSDGQLARMLVRALGNACVKQPLARLWKAVIGGHVVRSTPDDVLVDGENFSIVAAVTKNAQPELMWSIGAFNLVKFDGLYYGVPHGISIDWEFAILSPHRDQISEMLVSVNVKDVIAMLEGRSKFSAPKKTAASSFVPAAIDQRFNEPVLLGTMESEGYSIVAYEGWVYGMPRDLGTIDLTQVDVIEMPGVIRDVSRDAVETEILDRSKETLRIA